MFLIDSLFGCPNDRLMMMQDECAFGTYDRSSLTRRRQWLGEAEIAALLHEALADPSSKDRAMEQIQRLVEAMILTPGNAAPRIDFKGELAGILAMAQKKTAAGEVTRGRYVEPTKMVTGTRNWIYLLLFAPALRRDR